MTAIIFWNTNDTSETVNVHSRTIGPYRLSKWLSQNGHTSRLIDFCHKLSTTQLVDITSKLITSETVAIGVSTTFWYNWYRKIIYSPDDIILSSEKTYFEPDWVIDARELLEKKFPHIQWILGGAGVSNNWTDSEQFKNKIHRFNWEKFVGHSEDSLLKYLDEKVHKKYFSPVRQMFDITQAPGVYEPHHFIGPNEVLPMEVGRGCQFKCKFCRYPLLGRKKNTYLRNYDLVEQELRYNYENFGTTRYAMTDDTMNESEEKITALAEIAQRLPFKLEWVGFNRLDLIGSKPHTVELLEASGLRSNFFGIETFNPASSKMIGKAWMGTKGKDFLLQLENRWRGKINSQYGFMVGVGDETEEELYATREWCIDNLSGSWSFVPLLITSNPSLNEFPSTFDLEHNLYGYTFPDPNRTSQWENKVWTSAKATEVAEALNTDKRNRGKLTYAGWNLALTASAGYTFSELMPIKLYGGLDVVDKKNKVDAFIEQYVNNMLK